MLYWEPKYFYHQDLKIYNSAIRQHFQMKLCAYFTEYFRFNCTKFGQDSFIFHISVVRCVGLTFHQDTE